MTTTTPESPTNQRRPAGDLGAAQQWLDALSSGGCNEATFLRAVQDLIRKAPDTGWELLSLLDQYYRRGKLSLELFRTLKSQLESQLLGASHDIDVSVPMTKKDDLSRTAQVTASHPLVADRMRSQRPFVPSPSSGPGAAGSAGAGAANHLGETTTPSTAARAFVPPGAAPAGASRAAPAPSPRSTPSAARAGSREIEVDDVLRGRYRITNILGRGGTGTVFEAVDQYRLNIPDIGQRLAIKVLHPAVAERPEVLAALRREFQLLQALTHPNIVRVHDYDRDGDIAFFTMEYLSGVPLTGVLNARHQMPLDRSHAMAIIRDVGAALSYAHANGIVHGDLNPGNVFITDEGMVRVLDFGASHALPRGPWIGDERSTTPTLATPHYASCELLEGEAAGVRDDVYALACVAYVLLSGKHPFGEYNAIQARTMRFKPARPAGLTGPQWRSLRSGLALRPERRAANVAELLAPFDMREAAAHLPVGSMLRVAVPKRRHLLLPAVGAGILALLAGTWWLSTQVEPAQGATAEVRAELSAALGAAQSIFTQWWQRALSAAHLAEDDSAEKSLAIPASNDDKPAAVPASPGAQPDVAEAPRATAPPPAPAPTPQAPTAAKSAPTSAAPTSAASTSAVSPAPAREPSRPPRAAASTASTGAAMRSRIDLAADSISVAPADPAARIVVHRSGSLHGDAQFSWWTESGTAKPGHDFVPVAPHEEHIGDGKNALTLYVPVVVDSRRRQPKSFYVVIGSPGAGASLGAHTLAMVTIAPTG
jgi:serine/threonine protein kinase